MPGSARSASRYASIGAGVAPREAAHTSSAITDDGGDDPGSRAGCGFRSSARYCVLQAGLEDRPACRRAAARRRRTPRAPRRTAGGSSRRASCSAGRKSRGAVPRITAAMIACGPGSIQTDSSPTLNASSDSLVATLERVLRRNRGSRSACRTPCRRPARGVAGLHVLQQQTALAVDEEHLLDAIEQRLAAARPRRTTCRCASPRAATGCDRHDRPCSSVRLSDSTMPARLAATALRIAGPMTGKSASASGFGSRRTDAVIAFSTGGASARASSGSCACCSSTCGSTSPMSSARRVRDRRAAPAALRAAAAPGRQISARARRSRASGSGRVGASSSGRRAIIRAASSTPGIDSSLVSRIAISVRSAASVARSVLSLRSSSASWLSRARTSSTFWRISSLSRWCSSRICWRSSRCARPIWSSSCPAFFSNALAVSRASRARSLVASVALFVLGLDPIGERLGFLLDELLERGQALAHFVLQLGGLLQRGAPRGGEAPLVVAHLAAEQDVADLVEVAAGLVGGGEGLGNGLGANGLGVHGVRPLVAAPAGRDRRAEFDFAPG